MVGGVISTTLSSLAWNNVVPHDEELAMLPRLSLQLQDARLGLACAIFVFPTCQAANQPLSILRLFGDSDSEMTNLS